MAHISFKVSLPEKETEMKMYFETVANCRMPLYRVFGLSIRKVLLILTKKKK